jgi:hypothetical protein
MVFCILEVFISVFFLLLSLYMFCMRVFGVVFDTCNNPSSAIIKLLCKIMRTLAHSLPEPVFCYNEPPNLSLAAF